MRGKLKVGTCVLLLLLTTSTVLVGCTLLERASERVSPSTQPTTRPDDQINDSILDALSNSGPLGVLALVGLGVGGVLYRKYNPKKKVS